MKRDLGNGHEASRPSDDESIEATAAAWLAQRDDGLSPADERRLSAWRAADPRHETAVARLEGAWAALQPLRDFRPEAASHPDRNLLAGHPRATVISFPRRAAGVALLAAAALAVAAGWWTLRTSSEMTPAAAYTTTVGGYERVILADGSVLELNGDSAAEVRFTAGERLVRLARGEAHFTVAKNPARPFVVAAGVVAVRAVGTAFNVRLGGRELEVLVTEGRVAVSDHVGPPLVGVPSRDERDNRTGVRASGSPTFLTANERAIVSLAPAAAIAPVVEKIPPAAVREALAWQGSRLVFADTPLGEAIAQFNRRNAVQLALADADPALAALPIGGSFRAENVEAFVRLLESGGEVAVDRRDPARLLLRSAK